MQGSGSEEFRGTIFKAGWANFLKVKWAGFLQIGWANFLKVKLAGFFHVGWANFFLRWDRLSFCFQKESLAILFESHK